MSYVAAPHLVLNYIRSQINTVPYCLLACCLLKYVAHSRTLRRVVKPQKGKPSSFCHPTNCAPTHKHWHMCYGANNGNPQLAMQTQQSKGKYFANCSLHKGIAMTGGTLLLFKTLQV